MSGFILPEKYRKYLRENTSETDTMSVENERKDNTLLFSSLESK